MIRIIGIILLGMLYSIPSYSQTVYVTSRESSADINVYITPHESQSDLTVYLCEFEVQAKGNKGLWYLTKYEVKSDLTVYFTKFIGKADLIIYFGTLYVKAGWNRPGKSNIIEKFMYR